MVNIFKVVPYNNRKRYIQNLVIWKKGGTFILSDLGKSKRSFLSLPWFALKFEEGYDNYHGNIPIMMKAAGFRTVRKVGSYKYDIQIWEAKK